ncbi:MAG TPA: response regulator [Caldithrix abyssi]|uniref:Response regulator n=1 Tax=Caldithrix abyssi TaxID=187145 RepID=A0A7V5RPP6_CALAY|nr:response regulator [Caldithrix abyssi]
MNNLYSRSENIDELIRSVKLPYVAWKVLFLVTQNTRANQIADILQSDTAEVEGALGLLADSGLVTTVSEQVSADTPEEETAEAVESVAEAVEEASETAAPEEETLIEEVSEEESAEPAPEEEATVTEEAPEAEEETVEVEDALEEEVVEVSDDEDISIEIPMEEEDKDISEDLDFEVDLESAVEEAAVPQPKVETPAPEPESSEGKKKILVIDDSLVIRKMVEIALEDEDYVIETAVSGKEGLEKLDSVSPVLVILDMMLPDINGIEILKTIKASRGIPVIMLSGKDSPQMVENAKKEGAEEFLPKPFKDDDLVEKVKLLAK